jgi:predicted RNase H-like HicB family nuclease
LLGGRHGHRFLGTDPTSGANLTGAFANACEALDLQLESLQKLGKRLPKPRHALVLQKA